MRWFANYLLTILLFSGSVSAAQVFVYIDEFGNKVYSDKVPENHDYSVTEQQEVATVDWHKSPRIKKASAKKSAKRQSKRQSSRNFKEASKCDKIRASINDNEALLRSRLKADEFNKVKSKLAEARWNYRKHCT